MRGAQVHAESEGTRHAHSDHLFDGARGADGTVIVEHVWRICDRHDSAATELDRLY
jgi:hypothetical protein